MGKKSRDKGKRGELEAAKAWNDAGLPGDAYRGQQHRGGEDSPDIRFRYRLGVHLEAKRCEQLSLYPALDQAREERGPHEVPVVLHRRNRKKWVAILELDDLPKLIGAIRQGWRMDQLRP